MVGITSYGAYVPRLRLPLQAIAGRPGREGGPERSVAYFDEDAVTMGVAAAVDCLRGVARDTVDGLLFASTSHPYREKQGAAVIAKALDLRRDVFTADFGGSLRAGTAALRAGLDARRAGTARSVLVVASDCRLGAPRSALERNFGDGAAAFRVGDDEVAVAASDVHSISDEIIDVWRVEGQPFVRQWEERFVVEHGYRQNAVAVVEQFLAKTGSEPGDFAKLVLYGPDARSHAALARALRFDPAAVQDPLFGRLGNAGAAFTPLLLAAALEDARAGDRLLAVSYGDGADALSLEVTDKLEKLAGRRGVGWHLRRRLTLRDYDAYLQIRNLEASEFDRKGGQGVSATVHYRDRDQDISFRAHRCRRCGTQQFPFQRVCYGCFAKDDFDEVRLSDKPARILSYTFDYFAGSPDPPLAVVMVEAEGGCRVHLQMTDVSPDEVKLDLPVEFAFRKIHEFGGTPNYFWKCTPVRGDAS
ncbi:MAG: OB-fold domain-containing protein [Deltaproteobacteria bacterium]|nr:MAG: OB-fold domain-containing protein [Deltaproteobacteria bacterium]